MDNETTGVVTEDTARPVKKLVLKRKPIVKKAPKVKDEKPAEAEASVQEAAPVTEVAAEPKKRKGRTPKKAAEEKKQEVASESAPEAAAETPAEAKTETKAEEPAKAEESSERRFDNRNQNQKQNQQNQHNKKQKFNNNGKQQDPRANQKKPMSMEDIAISDEEYKSNLSNRIMVNDLVATRFDELKEKLAEMAGTSVDDYAEFKKQEVVMEIIKTFSRNGGVIYAVGTLEILSDGYGFLRSPLNSYLSDPRSTATSQVPKMSMYRRLSSSSST